MLLVLPETTPCPSAGQLHVLHGHSEGTSRWCGGLLQAQGWCSVEVRQVLRHAGTWLSSKCWQANWPLACSQPCSGHLMTSPAGCWRPCLADQRQNLLDPGCPPRRRHAVGQLPCRRKEPRVPNAASEDLHLGASLPFNPATGQVRCGWLHCCLDVICCRQVPR